MTIETILFDHGNVLSRNSGPAEKEIAKKFKDDYGLDLDLDSVKTAMKEALKGFTEGHVDETQFWEKFAKLVKPRIEKPIDRLLWMELGVESDHLSEFD